MHEAILAAVETDGRDLWVGFQVVRDAELDRAFAFDNDFARAGFAVVP